jgi:hypothetical protein
MPQAMLSYISSKVLFYHAFLMCRQRSNSKDCTDSEKRLFWGCIQMETRYRQDVRLPDSGLTSLDLVTEMYVPR